MSPLFFLLFSFARRVAFFFLSRKKNQKRDFVLRSALCTLHSALFPIGAYFHTNSADCAPADVLEMIFHIVTALLRVKHILSVTALVPHIACYRTARTSLDALITAIAKVEGYNITHIKLTVCENTA